MIISVAMIFILTVSTATLSTIVSGSSETEVQIELKALLEEAKSYGVFADSVNLLADMQSNIATNNLNDNGHGNE